MNDLVSVLGLSAIWAGGEPTRIATTLADGIFHMLRLDLVYVRLNGSGIQAPIERARVADTRTADVQRIGEALGRLGDDPLQWPTLVRNLVDERSLSIVSFGLGLQGELGLIVAGCRRADFPEQTDRLLLNLAANQAAMGLREARLLSDQRRISDELEHRVARRTRELATANEELRKEVAERRLAEEKLRQEEEELKRSQAFMAEAQRLSSTGSFSWHVPTGGITGSNQLHSILEFDPDH